MLEAFLAVVTFGIQQSKSSTGIQQGWYNIYNTTSTAIWNHNLLDRNVEPLTPGREMNMLSCAIYIFITTLLADGAVSLYTPLTGWSPKWNNWRPTGRAKSERSATLIWIIKQFSNFLSFWLLSRGWGLDEQGCSLIGEKKAQLNKFYTGIKFVWRDSWIFLGLGSETEHKLVYDLFDGPGYNPLIRPVKNISEPIVVELGVTLFQVITVVSSI